MFDGDPKSALGIPYEEIRFRSRVGPMPAWRIEGVRDTWAIFVHGYQSNRKAGLRYLPVFRRAGLPTLVISYRNDAGAPPSRDGKIHLGATEWEDLESAVEYARENGARRFVLMGVSMGGAIVSQFMRESKLARYVDGLVLDAPALSWKPILELQADERGVPWPILDTAEWLTEQRIDISWDELDQLKHLSEYTEPILLFHGTDDKTVPISTSDESRASYRGWSPIRACAGRATSARGTSTRVRTTASSRLSSSGAPRGGASGGAAAGAPRGPRRSPVRRASSRGARAARCRSTRRRARSRGEGTHAGRRLAPRYRGRPMAPALTANKTELPNSRARIEVEVEPGEVEHAIEHAAGHLGQEMTAPGFRKGKVPAQVVIQRAGRRAVMEEAIRSALPAWYEDAVAKAGIAPVGEPSLDLEDMPEKGGPLSFTIEVGVRPTAQLGDLTELEAGKREPEVEPGEVDEQLERVREAMASLETVDRAAENSDFLVLDFTGTVDGEPFEGGEARGFLLELGSGRLLEGFEQQLVGRKAGEDRTVEVAFPADHAAEGGKASALAGKEAVFEVSVKEVKEKQLPELEDDLAADAGGFDSLDELRADIERRCARRRRSRSSASSARRPLTRLPGRRR